MKVEHGYTTDAIDMPYPGDFYPVFRAMSLTSSIIMLSGT